jgi:hypothetical protein
LVAKLVLVDLTEKRSQRKSAEPQQASQYLRWALRRFSLDAVLVSAVDLAVEAHEPDIAS